MEKRTKILFGFSTLFNQIQIVHLGYYSEPKPIRSKYSVLEYSVLDTIVTTR